MKKSFQVIANKVDRSILLIPQKSYFSLIWLHGLGDSSAGFLDYFQLQPSPLYRGARINLLNAPMRSVTLNGGEKMNSWYDIISLSKGIDDTKRTNRSEIEDSLSILESKVDGEIQFWRQQGIQGSEADISKRIFIGGFSQGCAVSLCYGLTSPRILGGIIGFSGQLFQHFQYPNKQKIPMLVYHGDEDDVLDYQWAKKTYEKKLKDCGNFTFRTIAGLYHSVTEKQLLESTTWILQKLSSYSIKP